MLSRVLKRRTALSLGLAGLLSVCLLVSVLFANGSGKVRPMTGNTVWSAAGADQSVTRSAWLTTDSLVYLDHQAGVFVALAKRDGAQLWEYRVPAAVWHQDRRVCAVSGALRDAIAVSYQAEGSSRAGCSTLMVFDIATGKPRWKEDQGAEQHFLGVTLGAGVLVATDGAQQIRAFDAATGATRWSGDANCPAQHVGADDRRIVITAECADGQEVRILDPATGTPKSKFALRGRGVALLASIDPLVVHRQGPPSQVWVLSADGKVATAEFVINDQVDGPFSVGGGRLVVNSRDRGLVARDLRTGAELWEGGGARRGLFGNKGETGHLRIVKLDATELVTTRTTTAPRARSETVVLRIDPGSGAATTLSPGMLGSPAPAFHMFWDGGRLYGVSSGRDAGPAAFAIA